MTTAIAVVLVAVSLLAGLYAVRYGPGYDAILHLQARRRVVWFLAGFFLWPFILVVSLIWSIRDLQQDGPP